MAGHAIVAAIGVVCVVLSLLTDQSDYGSKTVLMAVGIIIVAYAVISYYVATRGEFSGRSSSNTKNEPEYPVHLDDFIDKD